METKNETLHFRVSPIEKALLKAIANREALKVSEVFRALVREAAARRGLWPATPDQKTPPMVG